MRQEFYRIYEVLYSEYVYEEYFKRRRRRNFYDNEYYVIKKIRTSIDHADKENRLRPDAKYFLLVNFHQMIVRPYFEINYRNTKYNSEIDSYIEADIDLIVLEAKKESDQIEISGHKIIDIVNNLWGSLQTTKLEIWG